MKNHIHFPKQPLVTADLLPLQSDSPEENSSFTDTDVTKPQVLMDERLKDELLSSAREKGYVILRCMIEFKEGVGRKIAIDKASILRPDDSDTNYKLLFIDQNIAYYPTRLHLPSDRKIHYFTLIFEGLPKKTRQFHFIEYTLGHFPFYKYNIVRNNTDVYDIKIDY